MRTGALRSSSASPGARCRCTWRWRTCWSRPARTGATFPSRSSTTSPRAGRSSPPTSRPTAPCSPRTGRAGPADLRQRSPRASSPSSAAPPAAGELGAGRPQYAGEHLGWSRFVRSVEELYDEVHACRVPALMSTLVTVVIPARNEAGRIGALVRAVLAQDARGLDDRGDRGGRRLHRRYGRRRAGRRRSGARAGARPAEGNPAIARNRGAALAAGDPIVFLDADCTPAPGLAGAPARRARGRGTAVVGGSLDLPPGLACMARCDYYCGWYHVHSRRAGGEVPNHPPGNLSVRRGGVRAHRRIHRAAAHRLRPRGAGLAGGGAARRRTDRVRPGRTSCTTTTGRASATSCGATIAGATAPSRARPPPAPRGWRGCTATPASLVAASLPLALGSDGLHPGCWARARRG